MRMASIKTAHGLRTLPRGCCVGIVGARETFGCSSSPATRENMRKGQQTAQVCRISLLAYCPLDDGEAGGRPVSGALCVADDATVSLFTSCTGVNG